MDQQGQRRVRARRVDAVLDGAHDAEHHRVHGLQVAGVGRQLQADRLPVRAVVGAAGTEVVLHIARPLHRGGVHVAFELLEDLVVALAQDVGQHIEPAAVGHADNRGVQTVGRRHGQDLVQDRDGALGAFQPEPLGTHVLGGQELLECLGRVQPLHDAPLALLGQLPLGAFQLGLDPALLGEVLDVHVLHADGAAVRVAQHAEQVAERQLGRAAHAAGEELAVEIPDGEAVGGRVQLRREVGLLPAQRVQVGDEVATDAVHADEGGHLHLLVQHGFLAVHRVGVHPPLDGLVRHAEALEDLVVEPVVTQQQLVDPLQEQAALRALDDAVVVRAGDHDDLADADGAEGALVGALELGRVVDRADTHDDGLAGHQPRHALDRADGARVGEADVGALEVRHGELVGLHLANEVLVGGEEAGEVQRVRVAQHRHHQRAGAVALVHVHRQAHVDVLVADEAGLAVAARGVGVLHRRHGLGDGPHDGEADEVGEADLALPGAAAIAVDDLPVDLQQLGRHIAEAGGGGNGEAALHVGGDRHARTTNRFTDLVRRRRRGCGCRCGRGRRHRGRGHGSCHRGGGGRSGTVAGSGHHRAVVLEELPPRLADRGRVVAELLVHLLDEPGVGPEARGTLVAGHIGRWYLQ